MGYVCLEVENADASKHSIAKLLAEELSCSPHCLHCLSGMDWKTVYINIHKKTHWIPRLNELLADYDAHRSEQQKQSTDGSSTEDIPYDFMDPIMMTLMKVRSLSVDDALLRECGAGSCDFARFKGYGGSFHN